MDVIDSSDSDAFFYGATMSIRDFKVTDKEDDVNTIGKPPAGTSRFELAAMATLMGSDLSKGTKGVGPVKARQAVQGFGTRADRSTREGMRRFFESSYECSDSQRRDFLLAYDEYTEPAVLSAGHDRKNFVWKGIDLEKLLRVTKMNEARVYRMAERLNIEAYLRGLTLPAGVKIPLIAVRKPKTVAGVIGYLDCLHVAPKDVRCFCKMDRKTACPCHIVDVRTSLLNASSQRSSNLLAGTAAADNAK